MGKYGKAYQAWPSGIVEIKFGGQEVGTAGRLFLERHLSEEYEAL